MAISEHLPDCPAVTRAGWQCPECRTVYSPDVGQCYCDTAAPPLRERVNWGTFGGTCTCTPSGLGTARCPVHQGPRPVTMCTCPSAWGGLCPPPACPVHGQTEMFQVRC